MIGGWLYGPFSLKQRLRPLKIQQTLFKVAVEATFTRNIGERACQIKYIPIALCLLYHLFKLGYCLSRPPQTSEHLTSGSSTCCEEGQRRGGVRIGADTIED